MLSSDCSPHVIYKGIVANVECSDSNTVGGCRRQGGPELEVDPLLPRAQSIPDIATSARLCAGWGGGGLTWWMKNGRKDPVVSHNQCSLARCSGNGRIASRGCEANQRLAAALIEAGGLSRIWINEQKAKRLLHHLEKQPFF